MPLDNSEKFGAAMKEVAIAQDVFSKISELPPAPRPAVSFAPVLGLEASGPVYLALVEVNDPVHKAADLIPILGLKADGNLAQQLQLVDQVIEDVKD